MKWYIPVILAFGLSACEGASLLGKFQELQAKGEEKYLAPAASEVVSYRCGTMSVEQRRNLLNAINDDLAAKGSQARASSLDCDGSGTPDF